MINCKNLYFWLLVWPIKIKNKISLKAKTAYITDTDKTRLSVSYVVNGVKELATSQDCFQ